MWQLRQETRYDWSEDAATFVLGALGGFAAGMMMAGRTGGMRQVVGDRARQVTERFRPARLQRRAAEQDAFTALEDAVLDTFLADEVLSERPIDVGAISAGIVELSGSVRTETEADRAVAAARRVDGVHTVINRMEIEMESKHQDDVRRRFDEGDPALTEMQHTGMVGGMGTRRQGRETDPDRPDDSHHQREDALERADEAQWESEGYTKNPRVAARPEDEDRPENHTNFDEDELDNQDPHGKHAPVTLDEPPQDHNPGSRIGEGVKPGVDLALEKAGFDPDHQRSDNG